MQVLGVAALLLSIYAGFAKWSWWIPTVSGFVVAAIVCLHRISRTPMWVRIARYDQEAANAAFQAAVISGLGGAAFHTLVYVVFYWLTSN